MVFQVCQVLQISKIGFNGLSGVADVKRQMDEKFGARIPGMPDFAGMSQLMQLMANPQFMSQTD